ncbi:hypothetical protein BGW37DRAFT_279367 [Umbelopsis sp. PMI_123]|nr:hypothetical protein BGW37DRAFT_279367 [Umbelopsis sp. PMI_123]
MATTVAGAQTSKVPYPTISHYPMSLDNRPVHILFPSAPDIMAIPMDTFASRPSYRISNPNNPYLKETDGNLARKSSMGHKSYGYVNDIFEPSPLQAWTEVKDHNLLVNGLPTLDQVLTRKTRHPLALENFEDFLKAHSADANLVFWREIYNHQKLWASLLPNIARRKRRSETESYNSYRRSKSSSYQTSSHGTSSLIAAVRASQLLPVSYTSSSVHLPSDEKTHSAPHSIQEEAELSPHYSDLADTIELLEDSDTSVYIPQSLYSWKQVESPSMLCYEDLQQNAKRIYFKFCTPHHPESRIFLPDDYRLALQEMVEIHHLADPIIFDSSFLYIYEMLNIFYYSRFLDSVMYKNLSISAMKLYMLLSVIFLTAGFGLDIAFILTGFGTRATRIWAIIPIFLGCCTLVSNVSEFSWWMGLLNVR